MNEHIENLMKQADYAAPELAGRAQQLIGLVLADVLEHVNTVNLNNCSATTYDMSVVGCARNQMIKAIANRYGIVAPRPIPEPLFPLGRKRIRY